ncbi:MAG: hypothetical protein MUF57_03825 [Gammaproteobacteria bacterium]|nr:hypothetical protein [Gammaproteobacteria bacterium]
MIRIAALGELEVSREDAVGFDARRGAVLVLAAGRVAAPARAAPACCPAAAAFVGAAVGEALREAGWAVEGFDDGALAADFVALLCGAG